MGRSGGCASVTKTEVYNDQVTEQTEIWVTQDQLAGPKFLNNSKHAEIMIKDMPSRPFKESESLRKAGVLQYMITED